MLATYKFVFNRKKQRLTKGETALVQLRVTINRITRFFSTGIYVEKIQWTGVDKAWIANNENAKDYNDLLNNILIRIRAAEIKALGHSDIKTTQLYAKMVDTRVANEMGKLENLA